MEEHEDVEERDKLHDMQLKREIVQEMREIAAMPVENRAVTVKDLDELVKLIADKEQSIDFQENVTKKLNKELAVLNSQAVNILKDLDREEYDSPYGKLKIEEKWRVGLPETEVDKMKFFEWLNEKGIFETYATVNSNSLNSLYFAEQKASDDPMTFKLPGIPAPKLFEKLNFRRKK